MQEKKEGRAGAGEMRWRQREKREWKRGSSNLASGVCVCVRERETVRNREVREVREEEEEEGKINRVELRHNRHPKTGKGRRMEVMEARAAVVRRERERERGWQEEDEAPAKQSRIQMPYISSLSFP